MVEEFTKLSLDIARQCIPTKTITVRDYDKPWFNNEIRKEIRLRDRLRINVFKFGRESDTLKYKKKTKKTRNKVNNMKKKAKENFESSLDNILLDNSTNPKTYWKIMKMQHNFLLLSFSYYLPCFLFFLFFFYILKSHLPSQI
jgi:hypothetical protein